VKMGRGKHPMGVYAFPRHRISRQSSWIASRISLGGTKSVMDIFQLLCFAAMQFWLHRGVLPFACDLA
jgi:hypothetical protein